jgi:hypothetical protein
VGYIAGVSLRPANGAGIRHLPSTLEAAIFLLTANWRNVNRLTTQFVAISACVNVSKSFVLCTINTTYLKAIAQCIVSKAIYCYGLNRL